VKIITIHKLTKIMCKKRLALSAICVIIMRNKDAAEKKSNHATAAKHLQEDILNYALHCSMQNCPAIEYCSTTSNYILNSLMV